MHSYADGLFLFMQGWVKIHRQLKEKAYYKDSEFVHLWLHLLLCANHCNGEYLNGYEIVKLQKGQFVTGRKKLSLETGISESKIERILKVFESEQQIEQQMNSRNRLISIVSWDKYQQTEQQMNSKRTASEQQVNTNNNDKKKEEEEEKNNIDSRKSKFASTLKPYLNKFGSDLLNDFYAYWTEPNKSNTKFKQELEKTWDLNRRLETWAKNDKYFKPAKPEPKPHKEYF